MGIFVIFLLGKLETWFWCQTPCFLALGIIWDHFQTPQICLGRQLAITASQISAIWDKFITFVLKAVETCFWCLFQVFWHDKLIGTILRHLRDQKAILSNQNKIAKFVTLNLNMLETWFWCLFPIFWNEKFIEITFMPLRMTGVANWPFIGNFWFEHAKDLTLVFIPMVFGLRNSFCLDWPIMAILASKMAIFVTFVFNILVSIPSFWHEKFVGPIFRCRRLTWMAKLSICPSVEGGDDSPRNIGPWRVMPP